MKNIEVEFKYSAETIPLSVFKDFCLNRKPEKFLIISGYDHFYSNPEQPNSFYRHRINTNENQLTFKRKKVEQNNYIREEHNIDLPLSVSEEKIKDLCNIHGYTYDTSIFKNCFIYNYEYYTLVYYICYNRDLDVLGQFIEIEMKEDYGWANETDAFNELLILEKVCKNIGAVPSTRINESLYEMFRNKI